MPGLGHGAIARRVGTTWSGLLSSLALQAGIQHSPASPGFLERQRREQGALLGFLHRSAGRGALTSSRSYAEGQAAASQPSRARFSHYFQWRYGNI